MKKNADGSPDSFEKQFKDLFNPLYYFLLKYSKDSDMLNRIVSHSIYEYYRKGYDLRSNDVVKQLYVAVRHRCMDELDKKRNHDRIDRRWTLENMPTIEDAAVHRDMVEAEFMRNVRDLIGMLPRRYREAVEGYYLKSIPAKELAVIMGIQVSSVHRLKDLGIEKLIRLLKERDLLLWVSYLIYLLYRDHWKN